MKQPIHETQLESMLTTRQVADFLQVSICTVRRWSDRELLKFYRVGSRGDRRYIKEDVLRFLEESTGQIKTDTRKTTRQSAMNVEQSTSKSKDIRHDKKKRGNSK